MNDNGDIRSEIIVKRIDGKVTLQEIANIVGVSKGTVDRALHNRSDINKETKQKILDIAEKLNYTPNRAARSLALREKKRIGVIIRSIPSFFWHRVEQGILNAYQELQDYGIDVVIRSNNSLLSNPEEQLQLIEELMEQNLEALIIVPVNSPLIRAKIHEIAQTGIKVVTLNDDIESDDKLFYIGPHMQQSGKVGAELMGKYLRGEGNIIIINSVLQSYSYQQRTNSFKEILNSRYPNIHIIASYDYSKTDPCNRRILKEIIENYHDLKGIYNADGSSLYETGCIVDSLDKQREITLIGHEIWSKVEDLISQGIVDAAINQDPYAQGYHAVRLLYYYLLDGREPEFKEYYTNMDIIVREKLPMGRNIINIMNNF